MDKEKLLLSKIIYNNYTVLGVKIINKAIFIKTYDRNNGDIYWFVGVEMSFDLNTNIKRILAEEVKYPNKYFRETFKNDYITSSIKHQKANERKVV